MDCLYLPSSTEDNTEKTRDFGAIYSSKSSATLTMEGLPDYRQTAQHLGKCHGTWPRSARRSFRSFRHSGWVAISAPSKGTLAWKCITDEHDTFAMNSCVTRPLHVLRPYIRTNSSDFPLPEW